MNLPKVSVIIPTYNRADLIGRAIKSVLDQTFTDFELIIVDDGSTDDTEKVVKSFNDPRIRLLHHETNRGGSAARNTGINAALGEYIAFNDSDDEWLPTKLEKQIQLFEKNLHKNKLGVVMCELVKITEKSVSHTIPKPDEINVHDMFTRLRTHCGTPGLVLKRETTKPELHFDESLPSGQEWDLIARLSRICEMDYVPEILYKHYAHNGVRIWNTKNGLDGTSLLLKKYAKDLEARPKIRNRHHRKIAFGYYEYNEMTKTRRHLAYAIKAYPLDIRSIVYYIFSLFGQRGLRICIYVINYLKTFLKRV